MLTVTLRELVLAVSDYAQSEDEVIATVVHMINSGRVHLRADLAGASTDAGSMRGVSSLA